MAKGTAKARKHEPASSPAARLLKFHATPAELLARSRANKLGELFTWLEQRGGQDIDEIERACADGLRRMFIDKLNALAPSVSVANLAIACDALEYWVEEERWGGPFHVKSEKSDGEAT